MLIFQLFRQRAKRKSKNTNAERIASLNRLLGHTAHILLVPSTRYLQFIFSLERVPFHYCLGCETLSREESCTRAASS